MSQHYCNSGCEEPHYDEHHDECECESCHDYHCEQGMNEYDGGLSCCTDGINYGIECGSWCGTHRLPFIDLANTICNKCDEELRRKS